MENIGELLKKFWQGAATDAERKRLLTLITQHTAEIKRKHWDSFQKEVNNPNTEGLTNERRKKLLAAIHGQLPTPENQTSGNPAPLLGRLFPFIRIAVAALAILTLGGIITVKKLQGLIDMPVTAWTNEEVFTQHNATQHLLRVTLPDSSRLHLAPGSSVSYQKSFNDTDRNLTLIGDARFNVAKNPHLPFQVTTKGYTVTALGTIFLINAADEHRIQVHLLEGKVAVGKSTLNEQAEHILLPGEELLIDLKQERIRKFPHAHADLKIEETARTTHVDASEPKSHKKTVLHFSETPIATVIAQLEVVYGKKICYDQLVQVEKTYSGRLSLGDGTDITLLKETLARLFNKQEIAYMIEPDRVVIQLHETQKNN